MIEGVLTNTIRVYGSYGLFFVMIVQTIIAPIPSEALLVFAGTLGLNVVDTVVFGGTGMVVGAILAFFIARKGRELVVKKLIGEKWMKVVDKWVEKNGGIAILISRLVPVIPFDLISYVAGLTNLSFKSYFVATLVGAYPRTFMLTMVGSGVGTFLRLLGFTFELIIWICIIGIIFLILLDKFGYVDKLKDTVLKGLIKKLFSKAFQFNLYEKVPRFKRFHRTSKEVWNKVC